MRYRLRIFAALMSAVAFGLPVAAPWAQTPQQVLSTLGLPMPAASVFCNSQLTPAPATYCLAGTGITISGGVISSTGGGGSGNVTATGSPVQYQVPLWVNGTAIQGVGPGTSGQCFVSNGAGSYPSFQSCPSAGGAVSTSGSPLQYQTTVFSGATTVTGVAAGTSGQALVSAGASAYPAYSSTLSDVTSVNGTSIPSSTTLATITGSAPAQYYQAVWASATGLGGVAPGTSGYCWTSNGAAAYPSWQACAGGTGTVNSGSSGNVAYYASTGTAVSGATVGPGLAITSGSLTATGLINAQTGTTYTFVAGDAAKLLTFSNASPVAVTLPNTSTSGFGAGYSLDVQNKGVGTVSITPNAGSHLNGSAGALTVGTNSGCSITSDGTDYQVSACDALGGSGSGTVNSGTLGQLAGYGASGTTVSGQTLTGDCSVNSSFNIQCLDTAGVAFAPSATTDTTNASNITSGTLAIAQGGTGQATANAALNALLPSQTGNSGYALTTNGTNTAWTSIATVTSGNFTGALTGYASNPTPTVYYTVLGGQACLFITANSNGTSNAITMTMTGLAAAVEPVSQRVVTTMVEDNGSFFVAAAASITSGGVISFTLAEPNEPSSGYVQYAGAFHSSGTKGLESGWSICYPL